MYRLPSESEWEFSCRGGRPSSQPFGIGDGKSLSSAEANFNGKYPYGGAAQGMWPYLEKTSPVGSYKPNALGLYDMHGNVWEWCADRYGPYPNGEVSNLHCDPTTQRRAQLQGCIGCGSRFDYGGYCRAPVRYGHSPELRFYTLGFRLARSIPSAGK